MHVCSCASAFAPCSGSSELFNVMILIPQSQTRLLFNGTLLAWTHWPLVPSSTDQIHYLCLYSVLVWSEMNSISKCIFTSGVWNPFFVFTLHCKINGNDYYYYDDGFKKLQKVEISNTCSTSRKKMIAGKTWGELWEIKGEVQCHDAAAESKVAAVFRC